MAGAAATGAGTVQGANAPAGPALVQTGGTRVHGTITDPDTELIPGATISFTPASGPAKQVQSGADGTYSVVLTPGSYTLIVSMPGFASYQAMNLKIPAVPSTTVDAKLKVGESNQVINVDADAVQLSTDPDANASSTVLQGKDLDALSDDPDELSSELSALAGPSAGPNGGQIYVDGFTGGQLPPKSSIREIRINQNPFSAQYDKLGFGRVEVFTKPGTDKIHGFFQINGNPSQFNSENPLIGSGVYQPPYHTIFSFGSLTGPLTKWASYSVGGSYRDIEDDAFTNVTLYAPSAGSTTLCAPGQVGCLSTEAQVSTHTPQSRFDISPRFDFALGDKNVLTTRFQFVRNDRTNQGIGNLTLPSAASDINGTSFELQMSDTQTFSSKVINETRFEYERERSTTIPLSTAAAVNVQGDFQGGGASGGPSSDHQDHFEVQNYTSVQLAKNFIRFGGRLRSTREAQNPEDNTNGSFLYSTIADYAAGTPSQFSLTVVNIPKIDFTLADLGLYAEDDWKPSSKLTVSYGLRYETQNHLSDHHDIAPRVSVAYGLGRKRQTTVLRGGFGLFYDRFGQSSLLTLNSENGRNETVYTLDSVPSTCTPSDVNACVAGQTGGSTRYSTDSNLRTPYIVQYALGGDQQVGKVGSLSLNYLHSNGVHQLVLHNVDYPQVIPVTGPPTGSNNPVNNQFFSEGAFHQNQLILNGRVQTGKRVSLFGYYSLNFAKGNASGAGSFLSQPYNINADYGRTSFDVRNRLFLGGSVTLPKFVQFSPFVISQSGNPYNVTTGFDNNGDSEFNDRPYLAEGLAPNTAGTIKSISGCGTFAQEGSQPAGAPLAPINACTGPALFTFNFRLTKTFGFGASTRRGGEGGSPGGGPGGGGRGGPGGGGGGRGGGPGFGGGGSSTGRRYNLAVGVQVQNLFNNEDLQTPIGTLSSAQFGRSTQVTGGPYTTDSALRRISLQASFSF